MIFGLSGILVILGFLCFYATLEESILEHHSKTYFKKHTKGFLKKIFLVDFLKEVKLILYIPYILNWIVFIMAFAIQITVWIVPSLYDTTFINIFFWLEIFLVITEFVLKTIFLPILFQIMCDANKNKIGNVFTLLVCFIVLLIMFVFGMFKHIL